MFGLNFFHISREQQLDIIFKIKLLFNNLYPMVYFSVEDFGPNEVIL